MEKCMVEGCDADAEGEALTTLVDLGEIPSSPSIVLGQIALDIFLCGPHRRELTHRMNGYDIGFLPRNGEVGHGPGP